MLNRFSVSLGLALLGFFASTGISYASAENPDRTEIVVGMFLVALGLMAVLLLAYLIKHALGLDKMPPAEPEADAGHH